MRKPLFVFLMLMAFASALLLAQTTSDSARPPTPAMRVQHHVQFLTTVLSLTGAQQQQATTIFTNAESGQEASHSTMKAAHDTLHNAIKANDPAAIDQAAAAIGNLMAQRVSSEAKAHAAFYQLLTPDQHTKLGQLDMHARHGPMAGPMGGHMGPHP